jgi:DNA polymerase/3'-5' exonuclease PolX
MTPPKPRFPANDALAVAREICAVLKPASEVMLVAGSLRRRRPEVGDVEVLFVPVKRRKSDPGQLSLAGAPTVEVDEAELAIWQLVQAGVLKKRLKANGTETWGTKNRLAVHVASGIPVDLFSAQEANWWSLVVCRTGSAHHNIRVCEAAKAKGWHWNPYGAGFYDRHKTLVRRVTSERDLFEAVGLPWREPWERNL